METNKQYKRVSFDIELAKKIKARNVEGRIVTRDNRSVYLVDTYTNACYLEITNLQEKVEVRYGHSSMLRYLQGSNELFIELPEETPNLIDSKSVYTNWQDIENALIDLFKEKASKNNAKLSEYYLVHYAAELFTWFRETHLIFKFRLDKLEELKQYAEEHIMEPSWGDEAKHNIQKIFGLEMSEETPKHEFKPFDKVLVRDDYNTQWIPAIFQLYQEIGIRHYYASGNWYLQCIPYEGNEHLVGTTKKI